MSVQLRTNVDLAALDGVEEQLGDALTLHVDQVRLEEHFGRLETFAAQLDHATVRQREVLATVGGLLRQFGLLADVVGDVAELLLQNANRLEVGRVIERVALQQQQLVQVAGDISAGDIESPVLELERSG